MRKSSFLLGASAPSVLLFLLCTPPPLIQPGEIATRCSKVFLDSSGVKKGSASGEVEFRIEGESHRGSIEIQSETDGLFKASFYATFGVLVASVQSNAKKGTVVYEDQEHVFAMGETMDTLPFSWGQDLAFGELIQILQGLLPERFKEVTAHRPDSCRQGRKTINALWKTDSWEMDVACKARTGAIDQARVLYRKHSPPWQLIMGRFDQGAANKIELRENDENYFSITYSRMIYK